jgi:hypothetical protein
LGSLACLPSALARVSIFIIGILICRRSRDREFTEAAHCHHPEDSSSSGEVRAGFRFPTSLRRLFPGLVSGRPFNTPMICSSVNLLRFMSTSFTGE